MKTKTEYPKWFYAGHKPGYKPHEPPKTVFEYKEVSRVTLNTYGYQDLAPWPENVNSVSVEVDKDYYDETVTGVVLIFANKQEIPNPQYDKLFKDYEKRLEEYKQQIKEWRKWKRIWDKEQEELAAAQRLRAYKKLKKEFEK